jgi:hypothetical protein
MIITYVNNKSSSFHSTGIGYTIRLGYKSAKYLLYLLENNINHILGPHLKA